MEYTKTFINELGNSITVRVSEKVINGVDGTLLFIAGPTSNTEIHVTNLEAKIIREQLGLFLAKS